MTASKAGKGLLHVRDQPVCPPPTQAMCDFKLTAHLFHSILTKYSFMCG